MLDEQKKKETFVRELFKKDVIVWRFVEDSHLWYITVPSTGNTYKFPEWNGWRWVIPNSLERPFDD